MTIPLVALAVLAFCGGAVGIPFIKGGSPLHHYLMPVFTEGIHNSLSAQPVSQTGPVGLEMILMGVSAAAALLGIILAALMYFEPLRPYAPRFLAPAKVANTFGPLHQLLFHKYYVDEIFAAVLVHPLKRLCRYCLSFDLCVIDGLVDGSGWLTRCAAWLAYKFDIYLVDGVINSLATAVDFNSGFWRRLQTGYLQNYAFVFILGLIILMAGMMWIA